MKHLLLLVTLFWGTFSFSQNFNPSNHFLVNSVNFYDNISFNHLSMRADDFNQANGFNDNDTLILLFSDSIHSFEFVGINYNDTIPWYLAQYVVTTYNDSLVEVNSIGSFDFHTDTNTTRKIVHLENDTSSVYVPVKLGNVILKIAVGDSSEISNFISKSGNEIYYIDVKDLDQASFAEWLNNPTKTNSSGLSVHSVKKQISAVYPNPAMEQLTVILNDDVFSGEIKVLSIDGKLVERHQVLTKKISLDISGLQSGSYFLQIGTEIMPFVKH